jgi:ligand-binding SRPBCC domain-containing protein
MKLKISTIVNQNYSIVVENFKKQLFKKLNPPFPVVKIQRYDGMKKNDQVHLELNFLFWKEMWISVVTDNGFSDNEFYFIDQGRQLPFLLKSWRHTHRILDKEGMTIIEDDIFFESRWKWLNILTYPLIFLQFSYRKPIYKKYFSKVRKQDNKETILR